MTETTVLRESDADTERKNLNIRNVPTEWIDRAEALVPKLKRRRGLQFVNWSTADVLRSAMERGLEQLEKDLELEPDLRAD